MKTKDIRETTSGRAAKPQYTLMCHQCGSNLRAVYVPEIPLTWEGTVYEPNLQRSLRDKLKDSTSSVRYYCEHCDTRMDWATARKGAKCTHMVHYMTNKDHPFAETYMDPADYDVRRIKAPGVAMKCRCCDWSGFIATGDDEEILECNPDVHCPKCETEGALSLHLEPDGLPIRHMPYWGSVRSREDKWFAPDPLLLPVVDDSMFVSAMDAFMPLFSLILLTQKDDIHMSPAFREDIDSVELDKRGLMINASWCSTILVTPHETQGGCQWYVDEPEDTIYLKIGSDSCRLSTAVETSILAPEFLPGDIIAFTNIDFSRLPSRLVDRVLKKQKAHMARI